MNINATFSRLDFMLKKYTDYVTLITLFIISRIIIYNLRPFEDYPLNNAMQLLDPAILRHHLLWGLYYDHHQPPLFNLLIGSILKIAPTGQEHSYFVIIYFITGLIITITTYTLMRKLNGTKPLSLVITLVLMLTPSLCLVERWLYYGEQLTVMLVMCGLLFYVYINSQKLIYFVLFMLCLSAIALTKGFYHIIFWMVPIVIYINYLTIIRKKQHIVTTAAISIIFIIITSLPYVKNYINYGEFIASTYVGCNIAGMTHYVNNDKIMKLIEAKKITKLALIKRQSIPEVYYSYYGQKPETGINLLDDAYKTTGAINYNNLIYVKASKEYRNNSLIIIWNYPLDYLHAVANSIYIYFNYDAAYHFFDTMDEWFVIRKDRILTDVINLFILPPFYVISFILAIYGLCLNINKKAVVLKPTNGDDIALSSTCLFCIFNIIYGFLVANFVDLGEECFYRIPTDPFVAVGVMIALSYISKKRLERQSTGPHGRGAIVQPDQ